MFWKPTATRIGDTFLKGYNGEADRQLEEMPKISHAEAAL
jgi:hypothetical protein